MERDVPLFTRPRASTWSLDVQVDGQTSGERPPADQDAEMQREVMDQLWKQGVWDPWEAGIEWRARTKRDYGLTRVSSEALGSSYCEKVESGQSVAKFSAYSLTDEAISVKDFALDDMIAKIELKSICI